MKKFIPFVVILILIGIGVYSFTSKSVPPAPEAKKQVTTIATYACTNDKSITASFTQNTVSLTLSDGRTEELAQVASASGARYANKGESIVFWNKGETATLDENGKTTYEGCVASNTTGGSANQIANPASENCAKVGGALSIEKNENGGEYGLCTFEEGKACEEWALMRGECPVGGVRTTGYETIDQKYCAWAGGTTTTGANSECSFKDGTTCKTTDFYSGACR